MLNLKHLTLILLFFAVIINCKSQSNVGADSSVIENHNDTIFLIDKQQIICQVSNIQSDKIIYQSKPYGSSVKIEKLLEQVDCIKFKNGEILYVNSELGNINNNIYKQLNHIDSALYQTGVFYNDEYNLDHLNTQNKVFFSTLIFSGAVTFLPSAIAFMKRPNPKFYYGPNKIIKGNEMFQKGYKDASHKTKKQLITTGYFTGLFINSLILLFTFRVIYN